MRIANISPRPAWSLVLFVIAVAAYCSWRHPEPPVPAVVVCAEAPAPSTPEPVPVPIVVPVDPPKPTPGPDVYARLAQCLMATETLSWFGNVSVDDVRRYVEVEHDPAWREGTSWWLPLSGEGEPGTPSGRYISVPDDGSKCGGAIMN